MPRQYKRFTPSFKLEAVQMMTKGDKPATQIARELDIRVNQLYEWRKQLDIKQDKAFPRGSDKPAPVSVADQLKAQEQEIKQLRKQLKRSEAEKDMLKKAAAYFAKHTK